MARSTGSAAVELVRSAPESAIRECVSRCAARLQHAAKLALLEVDGQEPEAAAEYLLNTIDDASADLRFLRAALKTRASA